MTVDLTQLSVRPDRLVRVLRQEGYGPGLPEVFGPSGLHITLYEIPASRSNPYGSVIVTQAPHLDSDVEWLHVSIARLDRMPDYADLVVLKSATFGDHREAYQVFATANRHISIHDQALHLWGRADGVRVLPDFGAEGTI